MPTIFLGKIFWEVIAHWFCRQILQFLKHLPTESVGNDFSKDFAYKNSRICLQTFGREKSYGLLILYSWHGRKFYYWRHNVYAPPTEKYLGATKTDHWRFKYLWNVIPPIDLLSPYEINIICRKLTKSIFLFVNRYLLVTLSIYFTSFCGTLWGSTPWPGAVRSCAKFRAYKTLSFSVRIIELERRCLYLG